jgi:hypothetical protein
MTLSKKMLTALAIALALMAVSTEAQQPASTPTVDPDAVARLDSMAAYLRALKTFQVEAATTTEGVLEDGQKVQFASVVNALARMPDRLRITLNSDRRDRLYLYDGKEFTMFAQRANYYATAPAPPTIGKLADELDERYGIGLPLEDLFRWGAPQEKAAISKEAITSAMFVGPSEIGGVTCGQYAFRQDGLDWQVWIQMGDHPLPRKLVLTTLTDEARPQYTAIFTWNLAPSFNEAAFKFVPPSGAGRAALPEILRTAGK